MDVTEAPDLHGNNGIGANWILWCRLCAKVDDTQNINIFFKDEQIGINQSSNMIGEDKNMSENEFSLATFIHKFFNIEMKREEQLPHMLCTECFSLVTSLVNFVERVEKVQAMYGELQKSTELNCIQSRIKYGLLEEERQQVFSHQELPEVHYLETKPNVIELQKIRDAENISGECGQQQNTLKIKNEKLAQDISQNDEADYYEYENDDEVLTDPFGVENVDSIQEIDSDVDEDNTNLATLKIVLNAKRKSSKENYSLMKKRRGRKRKIQENIRNVCNQNKLKIENPKSINTTNEQKGSSIEDGSEWSLQLGGKSTRVSMKKKHKSKSSAPQFSCAQCTSVFKTQKKLDRHSKEHLPPNPKQEETCPYCEKKYAGKALVEKHIKYAHMNERSFICEECGITVRTIAALREHMLTHTDYAPFECDVCHKGFKNKARLKKHKEIHDEKKHVCAECGKLLNSRTTLNRHLLVHSDKMQHKCDYCGRAFKLAKTLKNHLIIHTGLKPYSCDFCDRTFTTGPSCRTHKKNVHPKELAQLEASGIKAFTKNIPTIEALKAYARKLPKTETELTAVFAS